MRKTNYRLTSRFLSVAYPFFASEQRVKAIAAVALLVALLFGTNGLNVINSYVGRDFMSDLAERHARSFYLHALMLAGVFALSTVCEVLTRYTEQRLGILWREWLTRTLLDRYLAGRTYRRVAARDDIDNPDQRVTDDVKAFTTTTLSFLILLLNAGLTLAAFAGVLWSITPWLLLAAAGYAACGSLSTALLGWRLVGLDHHQLQKEADLRFALARFRDRTDDVALAGGEDEEKRRLRGRLGEVVANFRSIINVNCRLGFFTTGYNYMVQIIPAAVVAPLYISGRVEFGTVTQSAMAFTQVLAAFSLFVAKFQDLSAFAAVVGRVSGIWEATAPAEAAREERAAEPAAAGAADAAGQPHRLAYAGLTLRTPEGDRVLVRDLSLEVPQGRRIVVTGPTGAGKSALHLATAGLWEKAQGKVVLSGAEGVLFLARRPYLTTGTLRDVLLYALDRKKFPPERIEAVLEELGLDGLVRQVGGLDAARPWGQVLSEGEQQELAFARLLLACPEFAFLDDALADLDPQRAGRFYATLARTRITYVSVSNNPLLRAYHDFRLELTGDGGWRVGPARPDDEAKDGAA
jgi:putative ATP-binding cassette transporter